MFVPTVTVGSLIFDPMEDRQGNQFSAQAGTPSPTTQRDNGELKEPPPTLTAALNATLQNPTQHSDVGTIKQRAAHS